MYLQVGFSFLAGMLRLNETELAILRSLIAIRTLNTASPPVSTENTDPRLAEIVESLRMRYSTFDSYGYVTTASLLVYATALFDTFLTDTTTFLFTLHPAALGANNTVSVHDLLNTASKFEAVNNAIRRRVRSLSFELFLERLRFLDRTFRLSLKISEQERAALTEFSSLRNTVVHDQGWYAIQLDSRGQVSVTQKTCPRHPTPVTTTQYQSALGIYRHITGKVFCCVMERVLKAGDHPGYSDIQGSLSPETDSRVSLPPPPVGPDPP